jgi:hypothetical protein
VRNVKYIKGNFRKSEYERVVLTDTAPYEMPVIISNVGFYKNLKRYQSASQPFRDLLEKLIFSNSSSFTIPYRYRIAKDAVSTRSMSLPHPRSQYQVSQFYKRHDSQIAYYCSNGRFSIRRPTRVGSAFFFKSPISEANQFKNGRVTTDDIDKYVRNPASFFTYEGVDRFHKFFSSSDFIRLEKKFSCMTMLDVSKCFSSIYTHSVSWAIRDPDHAKRHTRASTFGNDFDKLMREMNYGETNGICIGPETSRIFAEIILSHTDSEIECRLG